MESYYKLEEAVKHIDVNQLLEEGWKMLVIQVWAQNLEVKVSGDMWQEK